MTTPSYTPQAGQPCRARSSHGIAIPGKLSSLPAAENIIICGCRCGGCDCPCCRSRGASAIFDLHRDQLNPSSTNANIESPSNPFSGLDASSWEANEPQNILVVPPSLELLGKMNEHNPAHLARQRTENFVQEVDDEPWPYFISKGTSPGNDANDLSDLFFGPMELDGSMENNPVSTGSASESHSMMSSHLSAMSVPSETASAVVQHTGAGVSRLRPDLGNSTDPFLKLL